MNVFWRINELNQVHATIAKFFAWEYMLCNSSVTNWKELRWTASRNDTSKKWKLSDARDPQDGPVQTAMDRSGRVAVIVPCLPPLSINPLPPLHRGEGYKEGGTVWNHNSSLWVLCWSNTQQRSRRSGRLMWLTSTLNVGISNGQALPLVMAGLRH